MLPKSKPRLIRDSAFYRGTLWHVEEMLLLTAELICVSAEAIEYLMRSINWVLTFGTLFVIMFVSLIIGVLI